MPPSNSAPIITQGLSPRPPASTAATPAAAPVVAAASVAANLAGLFLIPCMRGLVRPNPVLAACKPRPTSGAFSPITLPA